MQVTSISLSYILFIIFLLSALLSLYFKIIVVKTAPGKESRDKIIGDMKDPLTWREKNNLLAIILIVWSILSLCIFIYLKFFYTAGLISIFYLIAYISAILASVAFLCLKKNPHKN